MRGLKPAAAEQGGTRQSRVAMWLAMLALAFQCFVVQTHVHAGGFAPVEVSAAAGLANDAIAQAPHEDAACLLCEQMALAGTVLMPATHEIVLVEKLVFAKTILPFLTASRTFASHNWRSRAPPLSL